MTAYFLDTSGLGKHYHAELGSDKVDGILAEAGARHYISSLSVVELQSVLAKKVREGFITADQFDIQRRKFFTDLTNRAVRAVRVTGKHFQDAGKLIQKHGAARAMRTLDAIQLAVIIDVHRKLGIDEVVCSDGKFLGLLKVEGFSVTNPELP